MNDDTPDQPEPLTDEQRVLALSTALQAQFFAILNTGGWSTCPTVAAHACCELAVRVLQACVLFEPERQAWAVGMAEHVKTAVLASAPVAPGATRH